MTKTKNAPRCPRNSRKPTQCARPPEPEITTQPVSDAVAVSFRASIPPTETAIKVHGEGGARMQLDISEQDLGSFLPALVMRGKVLRVTLEEWT